MSERVSVASRKKESLHSLISEASKTASPNILRLVLEPDEEDDSIRLDFRLLAEQAIPLELRHWVRSIVSA